MLQSILTKYIPASQHRNARIKAVQSGWSEKSQCETVTVDYRNLGTVPENHWEAANKLATQLGWGGKFIPASLGAWSEFHLVWVRADHEDVDDAFTVEY